MLLRAIFFCILVLLTNAQQQYPPCIQLQVSPVPCQSTNIAGNACSELAKCDNILVAGGCSGVPSSALCSAYGNAYCCPLGSTTYFVGGFCQCSNSSATASQPVPVPAPQPTPAPVPAPAPTPVPAPQPSTSTPSSLLTECWDGVSGGTITVTTVASVAVQQPVCTSYDFECTGGDPSCSAAEQHSGAIKRAYAIVNANSCSLALTVNSTGYPQNVLCCNKDLCNGPAPTGSGTCTPTPSGSHTTSPTSSGYGASSPVSQPVSYGYTQHVSQPVSYGYQQVSQPVNYGYTQQVSQPINYGYTQQVSQPVGYGNTQQVSQPPRYY